MSTEGSGGAIPRKERKAQRDAERKQQKGKKRKRDLPEPDALPNEDDDVPEEETAVVEEKVEKKSKKRKAGEIFEDTTADPKLAPTTTDATEQPPKKKRQRGKKPSQRTTTVTNEDGTTTEVAGSKSKFIVFIGNLPYKTTDSSLQKHFAKLMPFTLRHRTDPKTKKSKGFAFLEFENYDRMKTCLKIYHHSMFDPEAIDSGKVEGGPDAGALPVGSGSNTSTSAGNVNGFHPERQNRGRKVKETARKINVELTAGGGGGKSDERKEKIKEKNVRLNEQRERRAELEKKEMLKREGKDTKIKKTGANADLPYIKEKVEKVEKVEDGAIHPARLAMMGR